MRRITVHIDRLVLSGVDREDQATLVQGLKDQFATRLAQPEATPAGPGSRARLPSRELPAAALGARELGSAAADAIVDGLRA